MKVFASLLPLVALTFSSVAQPAATNALQHMFVRTYDRVDTYVFAVMRLSLTTTNELDHRTVPRVRVSKVGTNGFTFMAPSMVTATNDISDIAVLCAFCKQRGVDLSPPSGVFYTYGEKTLAVRSTLENLDAFDKLLAEIRRAK